MQNFDIVIIGMGPVGAAGAIFLGEAGLSVAVIEPEQEVYPLPRAVGLDGEIVRAFQAIGHGDAIAELLQPIRSGCRAGFTNARREWLFGQELFDFGPSGWPPLSMFDQPELDSWLRQEAINHPSVKAFVGFAAEAIEDSAHDVVVTARNRDNGERVRCAGTFLIGCDGANSFVRNQRGIGWRDMGYNRDWLVVDVKINDRCTLSGDVLQVCDPERLTTYIATKDPLRRWEFALNPGESREEMLAPDTVVALLDKWTPRDTYEIVRTAVYQFHATVAERWRHGRVLIAGDAAHQTPPFLGQGLNSGMRDIINLAWKLPRVLDGTAPESLLDSYFDERMAHCEDLIDWAVSIGKLMEFLAAKDAAERGEGPPPGDPPPQSAGYGQGRMIPPLRQGILLTDQVSDRGSTGYQLAQPLVRSSAGATVLLDEIIGDGFAIVGRDTADIRLNEDSRALAQALDIKLITLSDVEVSRGRLDSLFKSAAAALIRPDRYIFGHTTETISVDDLLQALRQKLQLNNDQSRNHDHKALA